MSAKFCDENCNACAVIHSRQFSLLINTLFELYGVPVEHVAQEICPNFTCCADCHIDDFCHVCDDDGVVICEIAKQARKLAAKYRKLYTIKANED